MVEPSSAWRAQVDPTGASQSDGDPQDCGGTQAPAAPGSEYRAARRAQETKQEREEVPVDAKGGGGLSAETIAIMVTVLLSLASYGPNRAWNHITEATRVV